MFKWLFGASLLSIAASAALFSIVGIGYVFEKAMLYGVNGAVVLAACLEAGKLLIVSFLYRERKLWFTPVNLGMMLLTVGLMVLTSAGVYGFLSKGYEETFKNQAANQLSIEQVTQTRDRTASELDSLQQQIASLPANYARSRGDLYKTYKDNIERNQAALVKLDAELLGLKTAKLEHDAHLGPVVYLARTLEVPQDKVVLWLILLLVILADPLAVLMTLGFNRLQERNVRPNPIQDKTEDVHAKFDYAFTTEIVREKDTTSEDHTPDEIVAPSRDKEEHVTATSDKAGKVRGGFLRSASKKNNEQPETGQQTGPIDDSVRKSSPQ